MEIGMAICNFVAIISYFLIFLFGLGSSQDDNFNDLTIYTQASKEWSQPAWKDFKWADGFNCPTGYDYVDMGNVWLGTLEGNITESTFNRFKWV